MKPAPILAVVVMPTHDVVLVRIRFLRYAIIDNDDPIFALNLAHRGLHDLPQLSRPQTLFRQQPLNLVMAHAAAHQPCQTGACGLSERTDKVITIEVQQFFIFHPVSLAHPA
jgi:hypothetical protein